MTDRVSRNAPILLADDDADDRELARDALTESSVPNELRFVENGEQLLEYLRREGRWNELGSAPRPGLILLDLNMPKMNGREALAAIKADPVLRDIPVVVLTTASGPDEIRASYALGANSFITKPDSFGALVEMMRILGEYWFVTVQLPSETPDAE